MYTSGENSDNMRCLLILGSLLVVSVTYCLPSPCECHTDRGPILVTDKPPVTESPPHHIPCDSCTGTRTETISNVSRNSSQIKSSSDTKNSTKVKTKERKDGSTVTIIIDKSKTKNKTEALNDSFDQTNHTITEGGVEDSTSLTKEKQQQLKEVSIQKKVNKEKIVTAKNGTVISDTVKSKVTEKDKKSAKSKETETLVHTIKKVTTQAPDQCITIPPTPPCDTTTTTEPPTPPCETTTKPPTPPCETTTTTTKPPTPPCETTTTTTEPPTPPCETTTTPTEPPTPPCDTTTTTEPPRLPCGCRRTTTTTEIPETWPCGHPKPSA